MKVLKEGILPSIVKKKDCRNCKSKLEYDYEDIMNDREGSYIICPVCQSWITIKANKNSNRLED